MGALDQCQYELDQKFMLKTGHHLPTHTIHDGLEVEADNFYVKEIYEFKEKSIRQKIEIQSLQKSLSEAKDKLDECREIANREATDIPERVLEIKRLLGFLTPTPEAP